MLPTFSGVAHTAFIELYMLKREGQGDEPIFISRASTETEGIQASRQWRVKSLPQRKMP
jgi:hypothetical protein